PVTFKVRLQGLTAQSTMEAELVAGAIAIKEAVYCSNMIIEMGCGSSLNTVPIYLDNIATLQVIANRIFSGRTEHVALRFFFMRELVESGKITVHYIETKNQIANIGTKFLATQRFRYLMNLIKNFNNSQKA
ncbi:unnamed protein product, partial [Sphacelaria rigidula]